MATPYFFGAVNVAANVFTHGASRLPGPAGTDVAGTPANAPVGPRRVRLHEQSTGRLMREEWSDPSTGDVPMSHLPAGMYYMVAFDHTGAFGGVVETDIVAEAMPFPAV